MAVYAALAVTLIYFATFFLGGSYLDFFLEAALAVTGLLLLWALLTMSSWGNPGVPIAQATPTPLEQPRPVAPPPTAPVTSLMPPRQGPVLTATTGSPLAAIALWIVFISTQLVLGCADRTGVTYVLPYCLLLFTLGASLVGIILAVLDILQHRRRGAAVFSLVCCVLIPIGGFVAYVFLAILACGWR
jgi:hypothetical protein